jgi:sugar/nucleoside kinase (ribokinase family)
LLRDEHARSESHQPRFEVTAIDTTGAGDAYGTAMLAGTAALQEGLRGVHAQLADQRRLLLDRASELPACHRGDSIGQ